MRVRVRVRARVRVRVYMHILHLCRLYIHRGTYRGTYRYPREERRLSKEGTA